MHTITLKPEILSLIQKHGFETGGIVDLTYSEPERSLTQDLKSYDDWVRERGNASMKFMENNREVRENPNKILEGAKSALILIAPYAGGHRVRKRNSAEQKADLTTHSKSNSAPSSESKKCNPRGRAVETLTARYARGKDYHRVLKRAAENIFAELQQNLSLACEGRVVVDTVPFLERAHGKIAGIGFVGKNTMLIRPGVGSYFFIATLLLTLDPLSLSEPLEKKNPIRDLDCGDCRKCLDACPTQALSKSYFLDASKCLSYHSIEHRGPVDDRYLKFFESTIYGCDICQDVCPYNYSTIEVSALKELRETHQPLSKVTVLDMALMDEHQYEAWFGGTAMTRAKYQGLVRNALYHLWATGFSQLKTILETRKKDPYDQIRSVAEQLLKMIP